MAMFEKHKSGKQESPNPQEPRVSQPAPSAPPTAAPSAAKVALIGQGITIAGDVMANSNLKIEGRIEGRSVQSSHDIEISESGAVTASIVAKVVKIAGEVNGDVGGSEKVVIARSGKVQGNVVSPRVQLEDGALFRGSIDMNPAEPVEEKKPAPAKPVAADKASAARPAQARAAGAESQGKEPGLNLKSG